ncbi:MAG: plastocyanin/azurin family copper-binding protein, partial [Actinomycetota bacterium]
MRLRYALIAAALAAAAGIVLAPARAQTPGSPVVEVKAAEFAFTPSKLEVDLGATVRWTNAGEIPHVVTDRGGTFDTQPILPGRSRTVTFTVPGTYSYFCRVHPGQMNANLVVRGSGEQARANRVEANEYSFTPSTLTVAT